VQEQEPLPEAVLDAGYSKEAADRARLTAENEEYTLRILKAQESERGRLARFLENGFLRKRNVNPRLLYLGQGHDRSFQFAFQCAAVVDVFGKVGHAEIGLVENLKSHSPGLGKPGSGNQ
jgi:hypothetical protein